MANKEKKASSSKATTSKPTNSKTKARKKIKRQVTEGIVHIKSTFNTTIVSISDCQGNVIAWSTAAACGFKGSRKSTPFAAQKAAEEAATKAMEYGLKSVEAWVTGPGPGRESAVRALRAIGLNVRAIEDKTPVPHNGVRPSKRRRV